ncbi:hypothetical protein [Deinococcus multiflagellatus]|uniref:Uncharacterized protein n=1 Tax=Deinococcus multiflagellatus TaxID=1656887 RepID=A0ABW1ZJ30_9DEIO
MGATQTAQQVLETIRGDWLSLAMYDQRCTTATIPSGTTLTVTNLDLNGAPTGTVTLNASCSGNTLTLRLCAACSWWHAPAPHSPPSVWMWPVHEKRRFYPH